MLEIYLVQGTIECRYTVDKEFMLMIRIYSSCLSSQKQSASLKFITISNY